MILSNLTIAMTAQLNQFSKGVMEAQNSIAGMAESISATSALVAGAFGGGVVAGMVKLAKAAGSVNEAMGKVQAVFKGQSSDVLNFVDDMSLAYGMGKGSMLDLTGQMGNLLTGAGMTPEQVASYSKSVIGLANDLSRFNDTSFDTAFEKIRAGLSGESEPLKAFGILLNEDAVKLEAVRIGISKTGKDLTDMEKIQARMSLIWSKSSDAMGTAAREAGGISSQFEQLSGRWENLQGTLGKFLVPTLAPWLQEINTLLLAMTRNVDKAANAMQGMGKATGRGDLKPAEPGLGAILAGFGANAWHAVDVGVDSAIGGGYGLRMGAMDALKATTGWDPQFEKDWRRSTAFPFRRQLLGKWNGGLPSTKMADSIAKAQENQANAQLKLAKPAAPPPASSSAKAASGPILTQMGGLPNMGGFGLLAGIGGGMNMIGLAVAAKVNDVMKDEMFKAPKADRFANAMRLGSAEAADTINRARYGGGKDDVAKSSKETAKNTAKGTQATIDLGKKFDQLLAKGLGSLVAFDG